MVDLMARDAHIDRLAEIASIMRQLQESPTATVFYEMLSGGLVWSDEIPARENRPPSCAEYLRPIFNYRSGLILGRPNKKYREFWKEASRLFPEWPGFLPARRSPEYQLLYEQLKTQAMAALEDLFDR
jgi:hypothetical protein